MERLKRGKHLLIAFTTAYAALGVVCKRYPGLTRRAAAGLVEIYLSETGDGYNPQLTSISRKENFGKYVIDRNAPVLVLNDLGCEIVRAVIFSIRNRNERVRLKRAEEGKEMKESITRLD